MKRNIVAYAALVVSSAALVSSSGLIRTVPASPELPAQGQKVARELSEAFEAVADFVKPSVVQISVQKKAGGLSARPGHGDGEGELPEGMNPEEFLRKFFGPNGPRFERQQLPGRGTGTGSGFVYDDKGHIVTNNHVVEGAEAIEVTFSDGTEARAKVVGTDPGTDVAVIQVDTTDLRPMQRGASSKLKVGQWVLAIGSPFGLSQTVTSGIVSATERNDMKINDFESFIQTDAAINPGNSGGPLVDLNGRVIGINSVIMSRSGSFAGVGFAIPIDMATQVADKLIKDGKVNRVLLGIKMEPLTPALARQLGVDAKTKGVMVDQVVPSSPAAEAGLKPGDIIVGFEGEPVVNPSAFRNRVSTSDAGQAYEINYLREGKRGSLKVTPVASEKVVASFGSPSRNRQAAKPDTPKVSVEGFGLEVQALTPDLAKQLGYEESDTGLLVASVQKGSPAEAEGIRPGFLISKVIRDKKIQPVGDAKSFQSLVNGGDEFAFFVQAPTGGGRFVTLSQSKK